MLKLERKITWSHKGDGFAIEIVSWETQGLPKFGISKETRWNLYAFVYGNHKRFKELPDKSNIFDCPIPFHGGCTYARMHKSDDMKIQSKQFGCDYSHYGDDYFTNDTTMDTIPLEIMRDAEELLEWLTT